MTSCPQSHSIEFKRPVVVEYFDEETRHPRACRQDLSCKGIRIWIETADADARKEDAGAGDLMAYRAGHRCNLCD